METYNKQIIFLPFLSRVFVTLVDLTFIVTLSSPPMRVINFYLFKYNFASFAEKINLPLNTYDDINIIKGSQEFAKIVPWDNVFTFLIQTIPIQLMILGCYYVVSWWKFQRTPGMFILNYKIVSSSDYSRLSFGQSVVRFILLFTSPIGILISPFSKSKQALHDKIAGTVIIKA